MHSPAGRATPSAATSSRVRTRTATGAPAAADRSRASTSTSASRPAKRVWFSELRYSLNDLDSMMQGECAGMANSPMATTGLPFSVSQDSS
ncbi:hypothetical protein D3C75_967590 [compost metagenome]